MADLTPQQVTDLVNDHLRLLMADAPTRDGYLKLYAALKATLDAYRRLQNIREMCSSWEKELHGLMDLQRQLSTKELSASAIKAVLDLIDVTGQAVMLQLCLRQLCAELEVPLDG